MVRIAVLGAGRIGKIHARNAAAIPGCTLVGVADPFGSAAADLASLYGCRAESNASALLAREDVDAIVIGTPTDTHVDFILQAAHLGKAVLCEKPVDLDIEKARAAAAEVEALGARVMIAFNRRFDPSAITLRRAIDSGTIGQVRQIVITSRDPGPPPAEYIKHSGGIFRDMAIHDFDMARFLLGEEPTEILATASCLVDPEIGKLGDSDTIMVIMKTMSGKQCHINCCRHAAYGYDQRFEIFGSEGMLLNDNVRASTVRRYTSRETESQEPLLNFFLERYEQAYQSELVQFVQVINSGGQMPVTMHDGVRALRLADAALEASRTGQLVHL